MPNERLVRAIEEIRTRAQSGDADGAYRAYRDLFANHDFVDLRIPDQRRALAHMVLMQAAPKPATVAMIDAHCAARGKLTWLVATHGDASDHELLGICHSVLGDQTSANRSFKAALEIERSRNPQSQLCGTLMKRVAML